MKKYGIILIALFTLPAVLLIPQKGKALYFFAAKEGTRCSTCHVNPTGGMLRTQVGIEYAQNDHSFQEKEESEAGFNFFMGDRLQAGSDVRVLYNYQDTVPNDRSTFFTMQGALYLSADLGPHLALFFNNDFGYGAFGQNRELWGLFRKLPYHGYVKIGRFKVPYGIRLDDHTSFIKDSLGFGNRSQDNGIEVGLTPATFFAHLALTNGQDPAFPFDDNTYKAVTASAGFIIKHFSLGSSFYFNRTNFPLLERKRVGGFGSLSWRSLVLLAEIDYGWNGSISGSIPPSRELLAGYVEAGYQALPCLWLKAKLDYFDPKRGVKDDDIQRVTVGGDIYILKFSELKLQYRINIEEAEEKNNEFLSLLHVFF